MTRIITSSLLVCLAGILHADPPTPPLGKRWVLNPDFSDEFNGTELDSSKWHDHHPNWIGREPGLFMPSQVSVKDGCLQIRGEKMKEPKKVKAYGQEMTFTIAGGAVVSKKSAFLGYYECRAKAAATTMSTTFWFSTNGHEKGPNGCDKYGLEWDIHESIGRGGDFEGDFFARGMHSNSHYWYTDCEGKKHDHRAPQVIFEDPEPTSARFHTYGGWWRDETSASYYYDNGEPKHQTFYNKISQKPFDRPMFMRLVSETYPFPWIELPNDEELADPTKNVAYYDWVRGYSLIGAGQPAPHEYLVEIYQENITFDPSFSELTSSATLQIPFTYQANRDREIHLELIDPAGEVLASTSIPAFAGFANMTADIKLAQALPDASGYTVTGTIRPFHSSEPGTPHTDTAKISITSSR